MSAKKLAAEIERILKDLKLQTEAYDEKWLQLKNLCALNAVMTKSAPDDKSSGMKAKKKVGNRPQSVESMDHRSIQDQIARLKNDLETSHKRLYKFRQQMEMFANSADLKNTGRSPTELLHLKKDIEQRGKRGKVFYLRGVSSEVDDSQEMLLESEAVGWITDFLREIHDQTDALQADLEQSGIDTMRRDQVTSMLELHRIHAGRLEDLKRALQNKTLNRKGQPYDRVREELVATKVLAGNNEAVDDDEEEDLLGDVRDMLEPYIYNNEDMTYIVAEDIYDRLSIDFSQPQQSNEDNWSTQQSLPRSSSELQIPSSKVTPTGSTVLARFVAASSATSPTNKNRQWGREGSSPVVATSCRDSEEHVTAPHETDRSPVDAVTSTALSKEGWLRPQEPDPRLELVERRQDSDVSSCDVSGDEEIEPLGEAPTTSDEIEMYFCPGVLKLTNSPEGKVRLLVPERSTNPPAPGQSGVQDSVAVFSWQPDTVMQQKLRDITYLPIQYGQICQILATTNNGWSCGRCRATQRSGWFPTSAVVSLCRPGQPIDTCHRSFVDTSRVLE